MSKSNFYYMVQYYKEAVKLFFEDLFIRKKTASLTSDDPDEYKDYYGRYQLSTTIVFLALAITLVTLLIIRLVNIIGLNTPEKSFPLLLWVKGYWWVITIGILTFLFVFAHRNKKAKWLFYILYPIAGVILCLYIFGSAGTTKNPLSSKEKVVVVSPEGRKVFSENRDPEWYPPLATNKYIHMDAHKKYEIYVENGEAGIFPTRKDGEKARWYVAHIPDTSVVESYILWKENDSIQCDWEGGGPKLGGKYGWFVISTDSSVEAIIQTRKLDGD